MPSHFCLRWVSSLSHSGASGARTCLSYAERSAQFDERATSGPDAAGPLKTLVEMTKPRISRRDVRVGVLSANSVIPGPDTLQLAAPKPEAQYRFPRYPAFAARSASFGKRGRRPQ